MQPEDPFTQKRMGGMVSGRRQPWDWAMQPSGARRLSVPGSSVISNRAASPRRLSFLCVRAYRTGRFSVFPCLKHGKYPVLQTAYFLLAPAAAPPG